MNHKKIKEKLFKDEIVKKEYDSLKPIYDLTQEIIRLRIENDLTQKQLAQLIGTKQSAISRIENGSYNPSIEFIEKIAYAFNKKLIIKQIAEHFFLI